jgi:hypothetical protein
MAYSLSMKAVDLRPRSKSFNWTINSVKRALVVRLFLSLQSDLLSASFSPLLAFLWVCGSVILSRAPFLKRSLRAAVRQSSKLKIENHGASGRYLPTPKPLFAELRATTLCVVK